MVEKINLSKGRDIYNFVLVCYFIQTYPRVVFSLRVSNLSVTVFSADIWNHPGQDIVHFCLLKFVALLCRDVRCKYFYGMMDALWAYIWIFFQFQVNGNGPKEVVFYDIDRALSSVLEKKSKLDSASASAGIAI